MREIIRQASVLIRCKVCGKEVQRARCRPDFSFSPYEIKNSTEIVRNKYSIVCYQPDRGCGAQTEEFDTLNEAIVRWNEINGRVYQALEIRRHLQSL